jgi:hypothetical protein
VRLVLLGGAVLLLVIGAVCLVFGAVGAALWAFGVGGVTILGTLFERTLYKPVRTQSPLGPGWTRTKERFIDPESGKTVEVFYNATSGERQYVSPDTDRR